MSRYCFHDEDRRRVMQFEDDQDLQLRVAYVIAMGGHMSAAEGQDGGMSEIMFRRLTITWKPKVRQRVLAALLDAEVLAPRPEGGWAFPRWDDEGQETVEKRERRARQLRDGQRRSRAKKGPNGVEIDHQNGLFCEADFAEIINDSVTPPPDVNVDVNSHQHQQLEALPKPDQTPPAVVQQLVLPPTEDRQSFDAAAAKPERPKKPAKVRPEQARTAYVRDAYMKAWRERHEAEPAKPSLAYCQVIAEWAHRQDPGDFRRAVDRSLGAYFSSWASKCTHAMHWWAHDPARYFRDAGSAGAAIDSSYLDAYSYRPTREDGSCVA